MNSSPDRNTFQANNYIKRCEEEGTEPSEDYLNLFKSIREQAQERMTDPAWQQDNMEYDLRSTQWICDKVKSKDSYAQNLYAAMCNMQFVKNDIWPLIKDQRWSASWRSAGGIVADMREEGDYIDWYCSGMGQGLGNGDLDGTKGYVPESTVTDEVREDLFKLGWIPKEWNDDDV
jgi:hypothetical protein